MADRIRFGILGTGKAASAFARALESVPGAELAAVASRQAETAAAFAQPRGIARSYGGYEHLAADPNVDVIYIATPEHRHHDDCLMCLSAGKPVLCEKPFTTTVAEARAVVELARQRNLFCMEAMWMRFMPLVQRAKAMIADGAIGEVRAMSADFAVPTASRAAGGVPRTGALLERGVYCLSLASYLLGQPQELLSTANVIEGVDTQSTHVLRYASGATAMLWASLDTYGSNEAVVMGTKGQLRLHEPFYRPHQMTVTHRPPPAARAPRGTTSAAPARPGMAGRLKESALVQRIYRRVQPLLRRPAVNLLQPIAGNGYNYEAEEVVRCLREGRTESTVMPLDETVQIMELMDRARAQWPKP